MCLSPSNVILGVVSVYLELPVLSDWEQRWQQGAPPSADYSAGETTHDRLVHRGTADLPRCWAQAEAWWSVSQVMLNSGYLCTWSCLSCLSGREDCIFKSVLRCFHCGSFCLRLHWIYRVNLITIKLMSIFLSLYRN